MSAPDFDPRAQREAVSVAERMVRGFLEGQGELVVELLGKLAELDALGNYAAAAAAARVWLSRGASGAPGAKDIAAMRAALAGDPLCSLVDGAAGGQ